MSDHCNKLGMPIKVGQVWRDLDKRMHGRHMRVMALTTKHGEPAVEALRCRPNGALISRTTCTPTRLLVRRMHPHSTGWLFAGEVRQ
jgi:hypothetical protein